MTDPHELLTRAEEAQDPAEAFALLSEAARRRPAGRRTDRF